MDSIYCLFILCSVLFFLVTCLLLSPFLSGIFIPDYKLLSKDRRIDWDTRVTSTIHAIIVSFMCVYVFIVDEKLYTLLVLYDSPLVKTNCAIVVGYMIADMIMILINYKAIGDPFYLLHHSASIYAYCFVIQYGAFSFFANFRLVAEFSTPFVNLRWYLDIMKKPRTSLLFVGNGVAMTVVFFLTRILVLPYFWYKVFSVYGTSDAGRLYFVLVSSCAALDIMNLIWFQKMYKGARKVLHNLTDKNKNEVKAQ